MRSNLFQHKAEKEPSLKVKDLHPAYISLIGEKALSPTALRKLVSSFHSKMSDEILKGYIYIMPYRIAEVSIVQNKRRYLTRNGNLNYSIDWLKSKKRKAEIIAEGGTPLEVWYEDEDGVKFDKVSKVEVESLGLIRKTNGGTPYFIFHTSNHTLAWKCLTNRGVYKRVIRSFVFKPTKANRKALVKFKDYLEHADKLKDDY